MNEDRHERRRATLVDRIPSWYDGRLHFAWINLASFGVVATCVALLEAPTTLELLLVPAFVVFANWFEWAFHKGPLHHRWRRLENWFQSHTLEHHSIFTHEDMAYRSHRELWNVLFAPWWIPAIMTALAPIPLGLWAVGSRNLALLFYAAGIGYYWLYEWLHLLHHSDPGSWLGRRELVRSLRHHHTVHHDPAWMSKANFNISFPLWDHLLGYTAPVPRR